MVETDREAGAEPFQFGERLVGAIRRHRLDAVLYCGGGYRSALAADNLRQMGYTSAISLDGGWRALKKSGLPLA